MTRKSGTHLHVTYGVWMWQEPVAWTSCPVVEFCLLHTVVVGSISSGGDHGVHCRWDLIRSKQVFSAPYVTCRCAPDFIVMVISNLIYIARVWSWCSNLKCLLQHYYQKFQYKFCFHLLHNIIYFSQSAPSISFLILSSLFITEYSYTHGFVLLFIKMWKRCAHTTSRIQ